MATNSDTAPKITIVKQFMYRGATEEFSNTYHFSGELPANAADWDLLISSWAFQESHVFGPNVSTIRGYGYEAGQNDSVHQTTNMDGNGASVPGSLALTIATEAQGDSACTLRWSTPDTTSTGKKIYLRKFFHGAHFSAGDPDSVNAVQVAAMQTYGTLLVTTGIATGHKICGPKQAVASLALPSGWLTTRTLKRRGKRPPR